MTRLTRVGAAALAAVAVLAVVVSPVAAHASVVEVGPGDRSVLTGSPSEGWVRFSEQVTIAADGLRVFDSSGAPVSSGAVSTSDDGRRVRVALDDLGTGTYLMTWRVVSADGHPVRGASSFSIGTPGEIDPALIDKLLEASDATRAGPVEWAGKFLSYLGSVAALGAGVVLAAGWAPLSRRNRLALLALAGVGLVGGLAAWCAQARLLSGGGYLSGFDPATVGSLFTATQGRPVLLRTVAAVLLAAGVLAAARYRRVLPAAVTAAAAASTLSAMWSSHAATATPRLLVVVAAAAHVLAAGLWTGGVWLLAAGTPSAEPAGALRRFSKVATGCVVAVPACGALLAWRILPDRAALTATGWGQLVLVKVAAFVVVAMFGAVAHLAVRRAGAVGMVRLLRRVLVVESVVMLSVFAVTAVLTSASPIRPPVVTVQNFTATLPGVGTVDVTADPAVAGSVNTVHLYVFKEGRPFAVDAVEVRFTNVDRDIGPLKRPTLNAGPGHYIFTGADLAVPGVWKVEIAVRVDEFTEVAASGEITIRPTV